MKLNNRYQRYVGDKIGYICRKILPINKEYYFGRGNKIAICTLSSIDLLVKIAKDNQIMNNIIIVGRLFSENEGIDKIIQFHENFPEIENLVLCGIDATGHKPGNTLLTLIKNGCDENMRIIGSSSPYPVLKSSKMQIERFINKVKVIDMIGVTDLEMIKRIVLKLKFNNY